MSPPGSLLCFIFHFTPQSSHPSTTGSKSENNLGLNEIQEEKEENGHFPNNPALDILPDALCAFHLRARHPYRQCIDILPIQTEKLRLRRI